MKSIFKTILVVFCIGNMGVSLGNTIQNVDTTRYKIFDTTLTMTFLEVCDSTLFDVIDSVMEAEMNCNYYSDSTCVLVSLFKANDSLIECCYAFWMYNTKEVDLLDIVGFFQYGGVYCFVEKFPDVDISESVFRESVGCSTFFYHYDEELFWTEDDSHSYNIYIYHNNSFYPAKVAPCY